MPPGIELMFRIKF